MAVRPHGGGCCGMRHSVGYSFPLGENLPQSIYKKIRDDKESRGVGRLIEVVVTDNQLNGIPELGPILIKEGFKLVNSFRNSNSGNVCRVFHFIEEDNLKHIPDISNLLDASRAPEYTPPPPPPPPVLRWRPIRRDEYVNGATLCRVNSPRSRHHLIERPIGFRYRPNWTRYYYINRDRFTWDRVEIFAE
jgi:hypothetical protein